MSNRFWRINARPEGNQFTSALSLVEAPLAEPGEGEIVIRNQLLSMDAGTRMWMSDRTDGYQPPLPLGVPMSGLVIGRVVASRHKDFPEGTLVRAFGQWGDYSVVDAVMAGAIALDESVADQRAWFGPLGMNGWTALWGIERTGTAKQCETVLVSAAAGATGLLACQIAKLLGCTVWGLAGGPAKCAVLTRDYGLAGAIDYKAGGVRDALAYGVKVTGCTVHVATLEVDAGPILAQEAVAVAPDDTEATLHERIKVVERRIYAQTIRAILERGSVL